ncbi:MAG: hypothetical protein PHH73_00175 [Candidatus Rickettsiella isopodorum]|nr:hypothetical protein [Candidatus Rickettsiella isopodorum]
MIKKFQNNEFCGRCGRDKGKCTEKCRWLKKYMKMGKIEKEVFMKAQYMLIESMQKYFNQKVTKKRYKRLLK